MNPFLYRNLIFVCDAGIVYRYSKTSNAFSLLCIFLAKRRVSVPFSCGIFLAELNKICCGPLLNSILKTYRRKFLQTFRFFFIQQNLIFFEYFECFSHTQLFIKNVLCNTIKNASVSFFNCMYSMCVQVFTAFEEAV